MLEDSLASAHVPHGFPRIAGNSAITSVQSTLYGRFGDGLRKQRGLSSLATGWSREVTVERWILPPTDEFRLALASHRVVVFLGPTPLIYRWSDDAHAKTGLTLPGQVSVLPAGLTAVTQWREPLHVASFEFSPALVERLLEVVTAAPSEQLIRCRNVSDGVIYDMTRRIVAELEAPTEPLYGEMLCLGLIMHVLQRHGRIRVRSAGSKGRLSSVQARRVLEFIDAHLGDSLSVSSLACLTGLSGANFARSFRATFREPPHRLILRWRLERAAGLIAKRGISLAEAAIASGFCDQAHFSHAMRRHFGRTPGSLLKNRG